MVKILAVDDSGTMRHLVSSTLEQGGYSVAVAEDGMAALKVAKGTTFDLVLTDINMPKMNGITLVQELRKLPAYQKAPILILTTDSSPATKKAAKDAGATGLLVKPFEQKQLLAVIGKVTR